MHINKDFCCDLREPEQLAEVIEKYLKFGVCRCQSSPTPILMQDALLTVLLPDGSSVQWEGQVIRIASSGDFLVQLSSDIPVDSLRELIHWKPQPKVEPPEVPNFEESVELEVEEILEEVLCEMTVDILEEEEVTPVVSPAVDLQAAGPTNEAPYWGDTMIDMSREDVLRWENAARKSEAAREHGVDDTSEFTEEGTLDTGFTLEVTTDDDARENTQESLTIQFVDDSDTLKGLNSPLEDTGSGKMRDTSEDSGLNIRLELLSLEELEETKEFQRIKRLAVIERQNLARSGNLKVRQILVRDREEKVHICVFRNPQISVEEVKLYSAIPSLSKEAIRFIAENRTWTQSKRVVFNLIKNPATPLNITQVMLRKLDRGTWMKIARSSKVRPQVAAQAIKLLMEPV